MSLHKSSIQASISSLLSLRTLLDQIDPVDYQNGIEKYEFNTIGSHVRHILEFYQQLLNGTECAIVNYDNRQRNIKLEQSPDEAIAYLDTVIHALNEMSEDIDLVVESVDFLGGSPLKISSTISRELLYLIDHNTHHMALIRYMVKDYIPDLKLSDEWGYAQSTISHLNNKT